MSTISKPKLTRNQRKIFKKLVSFDIPNLSDMLRWDILGKKFVKLLCANTGLMDGLIKDKSPTSDVGLNSVQFKTKNRKENKKFRE